VRPRRRAVAAEYHGRVAPRFGEAAAYSWADLRDRETATRTTEASTAPRNASHKWDYYQKGLDFLCAKSVTTVPADNKFAHDEVARADEVIE
jgi:hypothetical protein